MRLHLQVPSGLLHVVHRIYNIICISLCTIYYYHERCIFYMHYMTIVTVAYMTLCVNILCYHERSAAQRKCSEYAMLKEVTGIEREQ